MERRLMAAACPVGNGIVIASEVQQVIVRARIPVMHMDRIGIGFYSEDMTVDPMADL